MKDLLDERKERLDNLDMMIKALQTHDNNIVSKLESSLTSMITKLEEIKEIVKPKIKS